MEGAGHERPRLLVSKEGLEGGWGPEEGDALPFYLNMSPPPSPTGEGWQWKLPTHPSSSKTMERIR